MIGYCCINTELDNQGITVNRGMIKRTFLSKGLSYVSELIIQNLDDCLKILQWNVNNNILLYRMSSDMFPWMSEYEFEDLPNFNIINKKLKNIGKFIKDNNIRTGFHPGPFNVLASLTEATVNKTISELNKHSQILDFMNLDKNPYYYINIHINTTKPSKNESVIRFCNNYNKLSDSCKSRLTIENDDSPNQYSVKDLYYGVFKNINIPIVFDQLHFHCGLQDQTLQEALKMALSTWDNIKPITHMSSSRIIEDKSAKKITHADYIYEKIETFNYNFDTELECKLKENGLLKYRKDYE